MPDVPETAALHTPDTRRRAVYLSAVALFWASLYFYVPILSPFAQDLGSSLTMVGLIVASYGLVQLLLRIPTGIASDRLGRRKPFVLAGFAFGALSAWLMAIAGGPGALLAGRSLSGLAATMYVPISVMFASFYPDKETAKAMGLLGFVLTGSQMLSTWIGGYLAQWGGWRVPFWWSAGAGLAGLAMVALMRDSRPGEGAARNPRALLAVGRSPRLWLVSLLAAGLQYITFSSLYGFTSVYATDIGATKADLGALIFISQLPSALANLWAGSYLLPRFGLKRCLAYGFVLLGASVAVIPFIHTFGLLELTQALGGVGRGIVFPLLMGASIEGVAQHAKSSAMGFFQSIYSLGMFGGPVVSGVLGDYLGYGGLFGVAGLVGLLSAIAAVAGLNRLSRRLSDAPA